tara:strand:+ start:102 stop:350 length:249 start_codon:yes stop_codon:yes gene_type:complete
MTTAGNASPLLHPNDERIMELEGRVRRLKETAQRMEKEHTEERHRWAERSVANSSTISKLWSKIVELLDGEDLADFITECYE